MYRAERLLQHSLRRLPRMCSVRHANKENSFGEIDNATLSFQTCLKKSIKHGKAAERDSPLSRMSNWKMYITQSSHYSKKLREWKGPQRIGTLTQVQLICCHCINRL